MPAAIPTSPKAGPRRCINCGHVGVTQTCLRCNGVMRFIAPSELEIDGSLREVCSACCSFVAGQKFCPACGHNMIAEQPTIPTPRAHLLASGFKSLGFNDQVSERTSEAFDVRADEVVIVAVDTAVRGSLKDLDLMIAYPNRPKLLSIGNGVALESLIVSDRRITGVLKKQAFSRSAATKHGFQFRESKAGPVFERDTSMFTSVAWNMTNPAWFNFSCTDKRTSELESFQVRWRTGLGKGASLFLTAALMSKSHTQADAAGNVYIASRLGQTYNKPVPTNLRLLLEEVLIWSVVRRYGAPDDLLAV